MLRRLRARWWGWRYRHVEPRDPTALTRLLLDLLHSQAATVDLDRDTVWACLLPRVVATGRPGEPFPLMRNGQTLWTTTDGGWMLWEGLDDDEEGR